MRSVSRIIAIAAALAITVPTLSSAQNAGEGVAVGYSDVGGVIGLGGIGGAGIAVGGRFSKVFKALPDMGGGNLGFTLSADWWSFDDNLGATDFGFTYIPLGGTVDYHFNLTNKKIDPFLGLGLGYVIINSDYDGPGDVDASALYFAGRAGVRYLWTERVALYADAGVGAAAISVGATLRLGR
ncbi:MAG: outer membrane beta-barrel protein [Gemmatimonadota bacterium]